MERRVTIHIAGRFGQWFNFIAKHYWLWICDTNRSFTLTAQSRWVGTDGIVYPPPSHTFQSHFFFISVQTVKFCESNFYFFFFCRKNNYKKSVQWQSVVNKEGNGQWPIGTVQRPSARAQRLAVLAPPGPIRNAPNQLFLPCFCNIKKSH